MRAKQLLRVVVDSRLMFCIYPWRHENMPAKVELGCVTYSAEPTYIYSQIVHGLQPFLPAPGRKDLVDLHCLLARMARFAKARHPILPHYYPALASRLAAGMHYFFLPPIYSAELLHAWAVVSSFHSFFIHLPSLITCGGPGFPQRPSLIIFLL